MSSVNDALQGQDKAGRRHTLSKCKNPEGIVPCCFNLWATDSGSTGKDELEAHMRKWTNYSEGERKAKLTDQLRECFDSQTGQWRLLIRGRPVCRSVFLLYYPISSGTLSNIQHTISNPHVSKAKLATGDGKPEPQPEKEKVTTAIAGWILGYCEEVGDRVGCLAEGSDPDALIIPRVEKILIYREYAAFEGEDAGSEAHFMRVWRTHPSLKQIQMARKLRNFQLCTACHRIGEGLTKALKSHCPTDVEFWRQYRRVHHGQQRQERLSYYQRRRMAASDFQGESFLSLIIDKWDSAKTTVPFWAREPSFIGPPDKHMMLQQHVLGVIVHGQPHSYYLYTFHDKLKGDGNMNIEGIRRTLLKHLRGGRHMPRVLYVQADNASDNKNYAMIGFLAALVLHDYCHEVQLSFLLVGHTHEDIDQFFSVLTRHMNNAKVVKTPQAFQEELQKAATGKKRCVDASIVDAVLDWTSALKPFSNQTIAGIQRATFTEQRTDGCSEEKEVRVSHVFRFTKRADGAVVMHYKEFSSDECWLPPQNPRSPAHEWVTDPEGIEMFAKGNHPPDLCSLPIGLAPYV